MPSSMWDLPGAGIEPMSPALAGSSLTTLDHQGSSVFIFLTFKFGGSFSVCGQSRASVDSKAGRKNSLYCLKDISDFTNTLSGEFLKTQIISK